MPDIQNLKEYVRALKHITKYLESVINEENQVTTPPATEIDYLAEFTDLRLLSKSSMWPDAIPLSLIGDENNEEDKISRANGILVEVIQAPFNGKRFLDYGCGDGSVVHHSLTKGVDLAVGYDINPTESWAKMPGTGNFRLVTDLQDFDFDIVLLYDVLDHAEDPVEVLSHIKQVKKPDAKVYVRCHPWTSRHGTHLYRKLNKAYLHLVFTEEELLKMGLKGQKVAKLIDPIGSYKSWFETAGLKIENESTVVQPVDAFFTSRPPVVRRIKEHFKESKDVNYAKGRRYPHEVLQIQFADFVLV